MKITVELPPDIVRDLKLYAARNGRKIGSVTADCLALALAHSAPRSRSARRERFRVKLPIVKAPPGSKPFVLSPERIHELDSQSELASGDPSLRR